ncbi:bifunctional phosphopantothenoylcysteine decarboxylase/phosphopantothenate--cysteine ligase CoaBC [Atopobium fossor]|uniref:bifunctional phosphopantothenoylcysteine decarboxylase/phosphopantothenate--cysteine ligase CoaBC n=1 Tax=Atopobium fossor TaxID=39487 RepID=UPI0003FE2C36|nr:bifunctional phosphopantothenoylcysteine decarboxylase/phosphopantothenate--cysteine ligase CoaBC [Atopobium fossor]
MLAVSPNEATKRHVLLLVTGGIAVYKAVEVLRALQKADVDVRVAITADACKFVGTVTFEALSGHPVATSLYDYPESSIPHIDLSAWADVVVVVPATANIIAKMTYGLADEIVSATLLACEKPLVLAAAMNTRMWNNPATRTNVATLKDRGVQFVHPVSGLLACGDTGTGKLAAVSTIVDVTLCVLNQAVCGMPLAGKKLVITAGPTHEALDPVRYISNASSGKMGYALVRAARNAGANVTLISGPVNLDIPWGVTVVQVDNASQMYEATLSEFKQADAAILTAAVADYTPAHPVDHKLKKSIEKVSQIDLVETKDILAKVSEEAHGRIVVGFAAETNNVLEYAKAKLKRKNCSMIVANDVSRKDSSFGSDTNCVTLVMPHEVEHLPTLGKDEVAVRVISKLVQLMNNAQFGVAAQEV